MDEKKAKVREHLRVMGVSSAAYLVATFVTAAIRVFFVCFVQIILILSFGVVSDAESLIVLWLSMIMFGFSLAAFAQIMPAFFARSTFSNGACQLFVSLCAVGATFCTMLSHEWYPLFAIFLSPVAFVFGAAQALFGATVLVISPVGALGLLAFQVILYAFLGQYLYSVNPGEYGVPKPLLFPIYDAIDFIKKLSRRKPSGTSPGTNLSLGAVPTGGQHDRIILRDLVKYYGSSDTPAVDKLSLHVREKEIFALLGHNGAGKTTTISILIGMLPASSYDVATVLGYDLNTQMDEIRLSLGCCPQFDVLFDDLSAREHLDLFAACKGQTPRRADELLMKLKLPMTDQKSNTFSGGMKRRLSVATALVGDSPLIFLDEPSSGLDPLSRRQLWELIKEEKQAGKTIILTTHFMEEADYLGDRIAIMSHGSMKCCDTSEKLKQSYGVGYYLNFVKDSSLAAQSKLSDWKDCPNIAKIEGYDFVDSISVAKKGYAGTRTYFKTSSSVNHICGFNLSKPAEHDAEGRVITTQFKTEGITVVNNYVPNAGMTLDRLDFRVKEYDLMIRQYLADLQKVKESVIWTGDLNVAERDYDRFFASNFKAMQKVPGFTPEERLSFRQTLETTKMIDAFRHLYPTSSKAYTFYSAKFQARQKGNGWRLDYFVVSAALAKRVVDCYMLPEYTASDHVPLVLWLNRK